MMTDEANQFSDGAANLHMALDAARMGTWNWDVPRGLTQWSESVPDILGVEEKAFDGRFRTVLRRIHPSSRADLLRVMRQMIGRDGPDFRTEFRAKGRAGRVRWVEIRGIVVPDEQGWPLRITGTIADISERKALEEGAVHTQKLETIGRLAGGVAHDFNNLLTSIMGHADLLRGLVSAGSAAAGYVDAIFHAAGRGAELTQQLLGYARKQVSQPAVVSVTQHVGATVDLMRRLLPPGIQVESDGADDAWHVRADPSQLEQIIMNLLVNAREAMGESGTLQLRIANVRAPFPDQICAQVPAGDYVRLTVADSGAGIAPDVLPYVFDPFFTTKPVGQGTGLGLSTCLGLVEQSGGFIGIRSEEGRGTTVEVLLPRTIVPPEKPRPAGVAVHHANGAESILIVEDDAVIRELSTRALRGLGYQVHVAVDGLEAMEMIRSHQVDLVVSDVIMPRMSGGELAARIRSERPGLRILFTSGYSETIVDPDGVLLTGFEFLQKPYSSVALARRIRSILDLRQGESAAPCAGPQPG